jgi:hypothetical protein
MGFGTCSGFFEFPRDNDRTYFGFSSILLRGFPKKYRSGFESASRITEEDSKKPQRTSEFDAAMLRSKYLHYSKTIQTFNPYFKNQF